MRIESNATPARDDAATTVPPRPSPRLLKPNSEHPPTPSENIPPPSAVAAPEKEGERGEVERAAAPTVSNADFIATLFPSFLPGARAAVCTKEGDPKDGGWTAEDANEVGRRCLASRNNYVNTSSFTQPAGEAFGVRKEHFAALHLVVLDDVGTKIDPALLGGLDPTWEIETSPGNSQVGILLREPVTDLASAERLLAAVIARGLCDPGATGVSRWGRLPVAINGKAKYRNDGNGKPFECRLLVWNPTVSYSIAELVTTLGLQLRPTPIVGQPKQATIGSSVRHEGDDIYTPAPRLNSVIAALKEQGLYKKDLGGGKHDITCQWVREHTDELDGGTAYFEPSEQYATGGFRCQHSHGDTYHVGKLLDYLEVDAQTARCKAQIRLIPGEINRINAAAEKVLAARGNVYAQGGDIVTIMTHPVTRDLSSSPMSEQALTKELAAAADWARLDKSTKSFVRCDPPIRNVSMLYRAQNFDHLPPLTGLVRQPFFREADGELVCTPGYDAMSGKYAAFNSDDYVMPEPTPEAAHAALDEIRALLSEFSFATLTDKATALSAILTAVVRPSLRLAPAFHVQAPTMGSGKSYLNEVIVAFATSGLSHKVSYPTTSEEATKQIPALLRQSPAVIEFDDMSDDWKAHGIMNRMLTSDTISERVLGASKTLTLSTRTLVLGSGNNVGPVRDLARRVLTIHLDTGTANPALLKYQGRPAELVRNQRARFITAALTIIMAWRRAACPRTAVPHIASYGDEWADHCRHPLIWLGEPDPAQSLIDQVCSQPDSEALGEFLLQWQKTFGEKSVTVRRVIEATGRDANTALLEAVEDLPIFGREGVNNGRLGWYIRKNVNRIASGLKFQRGDSTERNSWRVFVVDQAST